mmetsp:Transcript_35875/g.114038  ORF Transcript_35875/g.114038 Transcript_35875/m.114038 type:complete len:537 (-) Transcript_35875:2946-4556(-)
MAEQPSLALRLGTALGSGTGLGSAAVRGCAGFLLVKRGQQVSVAGPLLGHEPHRRARLVLVLARVRLVRRDVPVRARVDEVRRDGDVVDVRQAEGSPLDLAHVLGDDPAAVAAEEGAGVVDVRGLQLVLVQHAVLQAAVRLHPVEELAAVLGLVDRPAVELAPVPQQEAAPQQAPGQARDLEAHDADGPDLVDGRHLRGPLLRGLVLGLLAVEPHGLRARVPGVPVVADEARPVRVRVQRVGAARAAEDAAPRLWSNDPTTGLVVFEKVPLDNLAKHALALDHLVDGQAVRAVHLEVEAIQDAVRVRASLDHDVLLREVQVRLLPDHGQRVLLHLLPAPGRRHRHVPVGGLALGPGVAHGLQRHRLLVVPALLVVLGLEDAEYAAPLLGLRDAGGGRGFRHALARGHPGALPRGPDHGAHEHGVVEARKGRAHVGEGHLAAAAVVDDVLVDVLLVLDNGDAVHQVLLPVRHFGLPHRAVLPGLVLGRPDAAAVAHAVLELALVDALGLALPTAEVLDAFALRKVVLERAMVRDVLE